MSPHDASRYARITHRLAQGASSADDEASQARAELLQRRIVESIAIECASHVTSDLLSERVAEAMTALSEYGIEVEFAVTGLVIKRCFCDDEGCRHAEALLQRLVGAEVQSIITSAVLR